MFRDPRDIREDKIDIAGKAWDDDVVQALTAKQFVLFRKLADYWEPIHRRGRTLENRFEGKILDAAQKTYYTEIESKIVLEPPIAKAPIRALAGTALKSRKSGQIVTERGGIMEAADNSTELETINAVLKDMEIKTNEGHCITEALTSAFVSCYWNVILFDMDRPSRNPDGMRYKMRNLPWDSCLFGPSTIRKPDGSDIKEMFYFDLRSIADLIDNFPDMKKQITDHFEAGEYADSKMLSSIRNWDHNLTADERGTMYDIIENASRSRANDTGLAKVVMRLFPIKRKEDVWINIYDDSGDNFEIRPPEWSDEEWAKWQNENPHYVGPYEREAIVLWMTVFTTSGLMLYNGPHWFQENGQLPCSFWLGDVTGGQPTGPMADMSDDVLANCVAEIEYLDDMRKGTGRMFVAREGALTGESLENLTAEANKSLGVVFVSKDFHGSVNDAVVEKVRKPNDHWKTYAEQRKQGMFENTRINEALLGEHSPRQSAIAKEAEIGQALTVNARYIDNMNMSWQYHQNLKLKLIPYFYTDHCVIEIMDDDGGNMQMFEVNVPDGYDMEGNVSSVVNDLTAHRYRWKVNAVDDSPTAKTRNAEEAMMILNGGAGPLLQADPSGGLFAQFLSSLDNTMLKKMGNKLLETSQQSSQAMAEEEQRKGAIEDTLKLSKAKADLLRAEKANVHLNFRAQDLNDFPGLYELYLQMQQYFGQRADQKMQEVQQMAAPAPEMADEDIGNEEMENAGMM
jgi:hypothetical protein